MSDQVALTPFLVVAGSRVFVTPGFFYLVDTSGLGGSNVTFLFPPTAHCRTGDRWKIKKISSDSGGIACTPWPGENINGGTSAQVINTLNTSHDYIPGCPASYGGNAGTISW